LLWSWRCGHCSPSVCQLHSASPFAVTLRVDNPSFHVAARFIDQLHPPLERNPHSGHTGGRTLFRHRSRPLALLMTLVGWWQWMPSGCRLHSCSWRYQCAPCRSHFGSRLHFRSAMASWLQRNSTRSGRKRERERKGKSQHFTRSGKKEKEKKKEKLYSLRKIKRKVKGKEKGKANTLLVQGRKRERERKRESQHFTRSGKKKKKELKKKKPYSLRTKKKRK